MESLYYSLIDINPLLQCSLCNGYLVDPYTIKECMDTFCRTCILVYFEKNLLNSEYKCPKCQINLQPFSDISKCLIPDRQFGDILRSLLPSLDTDEINNEKIFYEQNSLLIPKDLRLKLRLVQNLSPMRFIDSQGQTRINSIKPKSTISSIKKSLIPIALQIELCKKFIDPSLIIKQYPQKYLCINSQLEINHIRKYIETICQISKPYQVYLFFYDSCLNDSTPLLLIKKLLFSSNDRIKLFFSIMLIK
jgi:hypothetical protein